MTTINKGQMITALFMGGASGSAHEFAQAVASSYSLAKNVLDWQVQKGFAVEAGGIYQRAIYRLPPVTAASKAIAA